VPLIFVKVLRKKDGDFTARLSKVGNSRARKGQGYLCTHGAKPDVEKCWDSK